MATATQTDRLMQITTPLPEDYLLIHRLTATEGLSRLYSYEVELLHAEPPESNNVKPTLIEPKQLLGQFATILVTQDDGTSRIFSGVINRFWQGHREIDYTYYRATLVPQIWLLTQRVQSRIFQHLTVPEILKQVFEGFSFSSEIQGDFKPRNYCVQYRESDFDFASRLMEEEGIFYYFEHSAEAHKMILANTPKSHQNCPTKFKIPFVANVTDKAGFVSAVDSWRADYKWQSGKVTLWDHNFGLPGKNLQAQQPTRFDIGGNKELEIYEHPAGYARKYDDIDKGGGERKDLDHIFEDNLKTAEVRMQQLDAGHKIVRGTSDCCSMTAGHRFELFNHPTKEDNATYVLESVTHVIKQFPSYISASAITEPYKNNFTCIEFKTPFRPPRTTPKPIIHGSQTAYVVGKAGEEITTDKYGRVKVQFHWHRQKQGDAGDSCWIRVAQAWAGNRWGAMFIPRVGQEVIVHFLEGDPDQPIITGCVYNPSTMPPYTLPDYKTMSTVKSDSTVGGGGFNEFRFEDKKGEEHIFVHGEKNQHIRIKSTRREWIGWNRHLTVRRDLRERIYRDKHIIVEGDVREKIIKDYDRMIEGKISYQTKKSVTHDIGESLDEFIGGNHTEDVGETIYLKAGQKVIVEAGVQITLKVGGNFVDIGTAGVTIVGKQVKINSGGSPGTAEPGQTSAIIEPDEAEVPLNADPGDKAPTYKHQQQKIPPPMIPSYRKPYHRPNTPDNEKKIAWIALTLVDELGNPVPNKRYRVTLPDGKTIAEGTTDAKGYAKVTNIDPGTCKITFPTMDRDLWSEA